MSDLYVICAILHGYAKGQGQGQARQTADKKAGSHIAGEPADDTWTERGPQAVRRAALFFQRQKVVFVRVVIFDFAGFDVVQPAVNVQFALAHLAADAGVGHEIFYLKNDGEFFCKAQQFIPFFVFAKGKAGQLLGFFAQ